MKILRRVCLGCVVLGAILLLMRHDDLFETLPFPGAGLTVRTLVKIKTEGDYYLQLAMPKADQALGLAPETVQCLVDVSLTQRGKPPIQEQISRFSRYAE